MRTLLRKIIFLSIGIFILSQLVTGIRYSNTWGIVLSVAGLLALLVTMSLFRRLDELKKLEKEEENEITA